MHKYSEMAFIFFALELKAGQFTILQLVEALG